MKYTSLVFLSGLLLGALITGFGYWLTAGSGARPGSIEKVTEAEFRNEALMARQSVQTLRRLKAGKVKEAIRIQQNYLESAAGFLSSYRRWRDEVGGEVDPVVLNVVEEILEFEKESDEQQFIDPARREQLRALVGG